MPSKGVTVRSRLNLKIDNDLKDWAMEYAKKRKTTVTSLICAYFADMREEELREANGELVEQI
ncbi:hypothetical protein UFOVP276_162 [uncultured Caudovirales phage]|uniref:Uncharacterized protein n=1 Tax=uncultured Caudovirales phage TaxID=2100421 RepID=A0A6J5LQM2_9CAUD|nr:hypothetical protein UFOVP127_56 [uncultured Caudovirales phage]CAB4135206.1 hypothetical protein UFOVP276_162 [uncultured Caudovirales phage]